jgi:hypothetical protein
VPGRPRQVGATDSSRDAGRSAARFPVFTIAKLAASANTAICYLEVIANERDDYYVASGEVPGRWVGSSSPLLGLEGAVTPEDLRSILEGLDPRTGQSIIGRRRNAGFDLSLSAPKSVSLLWGLSDSETASHVVARTTRLCSPPSPISRTRLARFGGAGEGTPTYTAAAWCWRRSGTGRAERPIRTCTRTSPRRTWPSGPTADGRPCSQPTSTVTAAPPA